jgi:hypothetical protein
MYSCMKIEKWDRTIKTIPGMGWGEIKENDGGGKFNYDKLLRTFVNVAAYLQ